MNPAQERGKLFVVATPIGNLGDMSPRAVETLRSVDLIAAEDTRVTIVLLNRFDIKTRLVSYHKFNEYTRSGELISIITEGRSCAVVTDAGTPAISDPGAVLVDEAIKAGVEVVGIPGPCAAVLALSVSGFIVESYAFLGFLPKRNALCDLLNTLVHDRINTIVCYESPHRIRETLAAIALVFPHARICLCNDLTKRFELIYRGSPSEVLDLLNANPGAHKGEYTLVFNKNRYEAVLCTQTQDVSIEALLTDAMQKNGVTLKEAVELVRAEANLPKKHVYSAALRLKNLFEK